ncbi:hypothetical protein HJC23_007449 [Cyclotella cryptica]|uniref:Uncharacterized protein n=1 Tax=Cyclotella cryptica TaxID=29204 RepID=A0ABD3QKG8_9STRA
MSEKRGRREKAMWFSEFLAPINCGLGCGATLDEVGASCGFDYGADDSMHVDFMERKGHLRLEGFASSESWRYFGDLVEAMYRKISSTPSKSPYALSIFTTDATLFADTDPESHVVAFDLFWKCVSTSIRTDAVSSINIIVVNATSAVQLMKAAQDYDSLALHDAFSNDALPSRLHIFQCINKIHQRIQDLSDGALKVKLEFINGAVDFQTLLQMWVRESFNQTYQSETDTSSVDGKIRFELPETIDGTMCSISLDLSYTILPSRIDSPSTMELVKDMKMVSSLSPASVEVLQAIPLQSVDSSLIYGVSMHARAGFENDLSQYNQMKMLVRQLWKYLSRNNVALILRVRGIAGEEEHDGYEITSKSGGCNQSRDQLFLLTSQVAVQKQSIYLNTEAKIASSKALEVIPDHQRKGEAPCNGILYRYATKNQILHFGNEDSGPKLEEEEEEEEGSAEANEYMDYIERSIDMLDSAGLNPFLVGVNLSCGMQ